MPASSVLSFIVPKLVLQAENAVTECLQYLLSTYPPAARALVKRLEQTGIRLPHDLEYSTQMVWERGGMRPDVVGTSDGTHLLILEAKFFAPLTKNQPAEYVRCLPSSRAGLLLFVAPAARVSDLWSRLLSHCMSKRYSLGEPDHHAQDFISTPLLGSHRLVVVSWERLFDWLTGGLDPEADLSAMADLEQVRSLSERILSGELAAREFPASGQTDGRELQLQETTRKVAKRLVKAGHATTKGYRATPGPGYYTRYLTLSGRINWFVGYDSEYWARFGESLIWLAGRLSPEETEALGARLAGSLIEYGGRALIPLSPRYSKSADEAIDQMARQAISVAEALAEIPLPSGGDRDATDTAGTTS